jgi:hypothetical protein
MKRTFLPIFILLYGLTSASIQTPPNLAQQVGITLRPPVQTDLEAPPDSLTLVLQSPQPLFYRLDLPDRTLAAGQLLRGEQTVSLPWLELEALGRVPLTLAVMNRDQTASHEFCLIFSQAPQAVDIDGQPLPEENPTLLKEGPRPSMSFTSESKRFDKLLQDIRATPAPLRPYELVDKNVYNRFSLSPVNLLLFAASYLVQKILSRKPDPLTEVACRYARHLETGKEWVTMRVSLIRVPLPERRSP